MRRMSKVDEIEFLVNLNILNNTIARKNVNPQLLRNVRQNYFTN